MASLRNSRAPISEFDSPRVISCRTSSSRSVSSAKRPRRAVSLGGRLTYRSIRRLVTAGASSDSPAAIVLTASASWRGGAVLEQEPGRARAQRFVYVFVEVEGGEHEYLWCRLALDGEPLGGLDPVQAGHADIHDHDVGIQADGVLDGLGAVFGLTDDLDVLLRVEDGA
jgi:hypothetical protein